MPALSELIKRERAVSRIVADTLAGRRPANSDALIFLRGGAAFWDKDHAIVSWGVHLPSLDSDNVEHAGLRAVIAEEYGVARWKFGSVPVKAVNGDCVFAITMFNGFYGDTFREFVVSVESFVKRAPEFGWILYDIGEDGSLMDLTDDLLKFARSSQWGLSVKAP